MSYRRAPHILAYDIASPKRLRRVHKLLKSWGLPVQYSVFALDLSPRGADRLFAALAKIVNADEDDVRLYRLGAGKHGWSGRNPLPDGVILTGSASGAILHRMALEGGDSDKLEDERRSRKKRIDE